jgi:hypothetical protein
MLIAQGCKEKVEGKARPMRILRDQEKVKSPVVILHKNKLKITRNKQHNPFKICREFMIMPPSISIMNSGL